MSLQKATLNRLLESILPFNVTGYVTDVKNNAIYAIGLNNFVTIGSICEIRANSGIRRSWRSEVVEMRKDHVVLMPFSSTLGMPLMSPVTFIGKYSYVRPHHSWVGRILDSCGMPVDDLGDLQQGNEIYELRRHPPGGAKRRRVVKPMGTGIRALDTFVPCCIGQRLGVFASAGVGKSMLLANIAKYAEADVIVIGLIGERGREAREFIEDYLGDEGLRRSVIVLTTSDMPALAKKYAAYTTLSIAEYFRDHGKNVLCIIDSISRFAMAQREIGLSLGEMPTVRGYTPSMYSELQMLLERAGPGIDDRYLSECEMHQGDITGLFSVLIDGDDDPVLETVRSILDGHIILSRELANRGIFPAIDIMQSLSRMTPQCYSNEEYEIVNRARRYYSVYSDLKDMIQIGIYRKGLNAETDMAIGMAKAIEEGFVRQRPHTSTDRGESFMQLDSLTPLDDNHIS